MPTIEQLRKQMKEIDLNIIRSIALRQDLCKKISRLKKQSSMPIIDLDQETKNFEYYEFLSQQYSIDPQLIERLFQLIIINSRAIQQKELLETDCFS